MSEPAAPPPVKKKKRRAIQAEAPLAPAGANGVAAAPAAADSNSTAMATGQMARMKDVAPLEGPVPRPRKSTKSGKAPRSELSAPAAVPASAPSTSAAAPSRPAPVPTAPGDAQGTRAPEARPSSQQAARTSGQVSAVAGGERPRKSGSRSASEGTLSVDHASPDTHLEDSFFKGGLSESVLTAQSEEAHDHEARVRSDRRQNAVYLGAAIAVAIALVGVVSSSSKTGHAPAAQAPASAAAPVQAERSALRGRAQPQAPAAQAAPVTSAVPVQAAAAPTTPLPAAPAPAAALPTAAAPAAALPAAVAPAAAPAPAGAIAALGGARPAPSPESLALRGTCEKALGGGKFKDVQTACSAAFDADHSAELASQVAQSALESGKKAEASAWAKKAIAANPDFADAYVFLGGAEQELGRKAEARAAYEKYLQLAPTGKFAEDIRAVVGTF